MAQHDYIISNQTFPNTRADLNNALQAIATNNSGSSAPTTLYAGQFWLDTNTPSSTTWSLYIHDGSDNILFAEIDTSANTVNFTDSALDVVTDTTPQLGGNLDTNGNNINFGNNDKANFGASNELQIYKATGGNSYIQETGTSNLRICGTEVFLRDGADTENLAIFRTNGANELYYDNSKKLETTSGGVDVTGTVTTDGLNVSGTSTLTGDVSVSGELNMTGTGTNILDYAGTAISARWLNSSPVFESIFSATREGDISLYHNGSKKLETTSTGIDVTGTVTADGLSLGDNENINLGASNDLQIYHDGANSYIKDVGTGNLTISANQLVIKNSAVNEAGLIFTENGALELYYDDSKKLETTSNGVEVTGGVFSPSGSDLQLGTNGNVRMYMISNGDIFFSNTTEGAIGGGSTDGKMIDNADGARLRSSRASTSTREHLVFYNPNGGVGSITTNGSSTSYNTSSDYRLKENVVNITSATERLKQLSPKRFNFIADANKTVDGFLAHEVSDIVPEAITGTKDAVDADGNPVYQGIDQSKLVPLLTASLKEAVAKIEELETRLTALET
jgi:hypothetical protein